MSIHHARPPLQDEHAPAAAEDRPSSAPTNIAFIVHSAATLTNNLPPNVDNKPLARQKRRRTSPEDQAILETEYQKNSKPDKAARMAIVERVALGEKEVQIWFQNRRQASRRKSKPLELHEIEQYQAMRSSQRPTPHASPFASTPIHPLDSTPIKSHDAYHDGRTNAMTPDSEQHKNRKLPPLFASTPRSTSNVTSLLDGPSLHTPLSSQERVRPPQAYLADLRNETPRSSQDEQDESPTAPPAQEVPAVSKTSRDSLRRTSSSVRLSMSFDGNAKIVTKDDSSPSPPRQRPTLPGLSRDGKKAGTDHPQLELEGATEGMNADGQNQSTLARKPSGRSRDSRAWEYWCDKDARSELEEKAIQETNGSAADAIGLIRSASGRNILGALTNKRTSTYVEGGQAKKPKRTALLQRSQSMQNRQSPSLVSFASRDNKTHKKMKKAQSGLGIQMLATDSDKENWSPERRFGSGNGDDSPVDSDPGDVERRRTTVTPGKTLLTGADHHSRLSSSSDPEDDEEIARFMGGGRERSRKSNSVSEEEELDCVQGLLSLSQGNWR